ncbi:MAG: hypothetical protein K6F51_04785 [Acetatifactor sp.]|nr:hypothetical protein [Acetatifactor sp.]
MKKHFVKHTLAVMLSLTVITGSFLTGDAQAAKAKDASSLDQMQSWYQEYKQNGNAGAFEATKYAEGITEEASNLYSGGWIYSAEFRSGGGTYRGCGSMGYRAYKVYNGNRANGFVTSKHIFKNTSLKDVYVTLSDGSYDRIGRIEEQSSALDAVFISLTSKYAMSVKNRAGKKLSPEIATVKVGDKVSLCGAKSGTISNIEVKQTSSDYSQSSIETQYKTQDGDSGSAVYIYKNGKNMIVGIHRGKNNVNGNGIVVKASAINSTLGLKLY